MIIIDHICFCLKKFLNFPFEKCLVPFNIFNVRKTYAFYGSLAAQAKAAGPLDNLSDVSDADPKDLLQNIVTSITYSLCLYLEHSKLIS